MEACVHFLLTFHQVYMLEKMLSTCEIEPQAENGIYPLKQKGSSHFAVTSYRHPLWIPTYSRRKPISSMVPQSAGLVESDFCSDPRGWNRFFSSSSDWSIYRFGHYVVCVLRGTISSGHTHYITQPSPHLKGQICTHMRRKSEEVETVVSEWPSLLLLQHKF